MLPIGFSNSLGHATRRITPVVLQQRECVNFHLARVRTAGKIGRKSGKKSGKIGRKGRNSGVYSGCEVPGGILSGMEGRFAGGNSMNANNGVDMAWIWRGYRVVCRYREGYIKVTYTIGGWVRHGWFAGRVRVRESYIYREKGKLDSALQSTQPPRLQWCAFGSLYTARYSFFAASRPW